MLESEGMGLAPTPTVRAARKTEKILENFMLFDS